MRRAFQAKSRAIYSRGKYRNGTGTQALQRHLASACAASTRTTRDLITRPSNTVRPQAPQCTGVRMGVGVFSAGSILNQCLGRNTGFQIVFGNLSSLTG